jgi:HAAS domain-containing protein
MTASGHQQSTDPRVASYLDALNRALYGLPESVHADVYGEIRQHIDDELAQRPGDESAIPEVLDRLGDPLEIAREAGAYPLQAPPPHRSGRLHEIFAVILIAIGGFIAGIGWIVGVVLLWTSSRFTRADKVIGTILVPGGFLGSLLALGIGLVGPTTQETCSSGPNAPRVHRIKIPHTEATSYLTQSVTTTCTGGHSALFTVVVIALLLIALLGPLYTVIRLSRRVAAM